MKSIANTKELLAFVFSQMQKLDDSKITNQQAREQANMVKQANNILRYELDRTKLMMELKSHNGRSGDTLKIREIEEKSLSNF